MFQIAFFRLGWGVGNALFIATALSVIVGAASGGLTSAIVLYEAALGLGIASGPLLGGLLGGISWRGPFFGTAALMAVGFVLITVMLGPVPKPARRVSLTDPLKALGHGGLRSMAIVAVLYNFGFFTILAYTPFPLGLSTHQLGIVYFGWGLLVALTLGVRGAAARAPVRARGRARRGARGRRGRPVRRRRLHRLDRGADRRRGGERRAARHRQHGPDRGRDGRGGRRASGRLGRLQLRALHRRRDRTVVAGKLGEHVSAGAPMYLGARMVALSVVALMLSRHHLRHRDAEVEVASPETVPAAAILVAIDSAPSSRLVATAERVARARGAAVHIVHVRETRVIADDTADLEDRAAAGAIVDAAVTRLTDAGIAGATGEVLHVTGHHAEAADAVLDLAVRTAPQAVIVGRPTHSEPGEPSLTTALTERAPCDVVVVARSA